MYTIIKLSRPGWDKTFDTEEEARVELHNHICNECIDAYDIGINCTIDDLLATDCGCEYYVEIEE
jgi:hypothetical protein